MNHVLNFSHDVNRKTQHRIPKQNQWEIYNQTITRGDSGDQYGKTGPEKMIH